MKRIQVKPSDHNKKVLQRERKRNTARAAQPSWFSPWPGQGVPPRQDLGQDFGQNPSPPKGPGSRDQERALGPKTMGTDKQTENITFP